MSKVAALSQRGILCGLALFLSGLARGDIELPDSNYLLIEDLERPENSRLLVFAPSDRADSEGDQATVLPDEVLEALADSHDSDPTVRTRALTLLSGNKSSETLSVALLLLHDPNPAVREEAFQLALYHPDVEFDQVASMGLADPSSRVQAATADCVAERQDD